MHRANKGTALAHLGELHSLREKQMFSANNRNSAEPGAQRLPQYGNIYNFLALATRGKKNKCPAESKTANEANTSKAVIIATNP